MKPSLDLLTDTHIKRSILYLALPSIFALMIQAVYNIVDTAYIGMLNNDLSLAAVGITFPLLLIINSLEQILAMGGSILLSKQLGEESASRFKEIIKTSTLFISSIGLSVSFLYILFSKKIVHIFSSTPQIIQYGHWLIISQVALYLLFACTYLITIILQVAGKGRSAALVSSMRQGIVFIPLSLILCCCIGVTGLYLTQPIADIFTFILSLTCLYKNLPSLNQHFSS